MNQNEFDIQMEIVPLQNEIKKLKSDNKYLEKKIADMDQCNFICGALIFAGKYLIVLCAIIGVIGMFKGFK